MLGADEMRAWYGPDHVCLAADRGAIGTLLISDDLFRQVNIQILAACIINLYFQLERSSYSQEIRRGDGGSSTERRGSIDILEYA